MSKQEKLISAEKLQEWIDEMFNKRFTNDVYGYQDGRQSILDLLEQRINDGTFNADPVPTIKPGEELLPESIYQHFNNSTTTLHFNEDRYLLKHNITSIEKLPRLET
ncbi:hypothetical protein ACFSUM_18625 [Virgibacillus siamensis]|uniref:hypothetical protein n=1 Tax=Virgibacillus siamensis TaxID=480071 RepID=UPI00364330DF